MLSLQISAMKAMNNPPESAAPPAAVANHPKVALDVEPVFARR